MQVSAEVRWFWRSGPPSHLQDWFNKPSPDSCSVGGGQVRIDEYLSDPSQAELGIKRRGGKQGVEVKGLVGQAERRLSAGPFVGVIEIWSKWTTEALEVDPAKSIKTSKRRWLRKFDTTGDSPVEVPLNESEKPVDARQSLPERGCNVELTEITLERGDVWWTFGLEAFGGLTTVAEDLRRVAGTLAEGLQLDLSQGLLASYPAWLGDHASQA